MKQLQCADDQIRDIKILIDLIKNDTNNSQNIIDKLMTIKNTILLISDQQYKSEIYNQQLPIKQYTIDDIQQWLKKIKGRNELIIGGNYCEVIAIINRGIYLTRRFYLRHTQLLAVLLLLHNKSTLEQVSTGEGKSLIVVAASIIKALCGETVDIVTSSSVLAKRDSESEPPKGNIYLYFINKL